MHRTWLDGITRVLSVHVCLRRRPSPLTFEESNPTSLEMIVKVVVALRQQMQEEEDGGVCVDDNFPHFITATIATSGAAGDFFCWSNVSQINMSSISGQSEQYQDKSDAFFREPNGLMGCPPHYANKELVGWVVVFLLKARIVWNFNVYKSVACDVRKEAEWGHHHKLDDNANIEKKQLLYLTNFTESRMCALPLLYPLQSYRHKKIFFFECVNRIRPLLCGRKAPKSRKCNLIKRNLSKQYFTKPRKSKLWGEKNTMFTDKAKNLV